MSFRPQFSKRTAVFAPGVVGISAWGVAILLYYGAHEYWRATDNAIGANSFILGGLHEGGMMHGSVGVLMHHVEDEPNRQDDRCD
jgi:hypothetical protein